MLTLLAKLFHALNSESSSRQIALAITLGFIVGLGPMYTLPNAFLLFIALLIRVHLGAFILAAGFFSGVSYLCSGIIVGVGESILTMPALLDTFTALYQITLFKLSHLHHTYTLGALVSGFVLATPVYFIVKFLIEKYRIAIQAMFEKFRIVKILKGSRFYQIYLELSA